MKKSIISIFALAAIISIAGAYYYQQQHKQITLQESPDSPLPPPAPAGATESANIPPGQPPMADNAISRATGLDEATGEMGWFYTRFGYSTWFEEGKFNVKSFTEAEYNNLIYASLAGNESATLALKLTLLKHFKANPDDPEYKTFKDKLWSKEFLQRVPRLEYLVDALPDELMDDKEFVSEILKKNGAFLKFASERLRADKVVVLQAIAQDPLPLEFASDVIRSDREFASKALERGSHGLCYLSDELRSDKKFVETYISRDKYALRCLSDKLLSDKRYVLELIEKKNLPLRDVKGRLSDDKDVVIAALKNDPKFYFSASERLQNDPSILPIIRAYVLTPSAQIYSGLPEKLRGDREVMKKVVARSCGLLESAAPEIKDDDEIVGIAYSVNQRCLRYASERLKKEMGYTENQDGEAD